MKFKEKNTVGFLIGLKGKRIQRCLLKLDAVLRHANKNESDNLPHSSLGIPQTRPHTHEHEITEWVIGFSESHKNNQFPINSVYLGIACGCAINGKPVALRKHGLNRWVVQGHFKGNTILLTEGISNRRMTSRIKCLKLIPLNHIQVCFSGSACGKSQAIKSLIHQFPMLKRKNGICQSTG